MPVQKKEEEELTAYINGKDGFTFQSLSAILTIFLRLKREVVLFLTIGWKLEQKEDDVKDKAAGILRGVLGNSVITRIKSNNHYLNSL